MPSKGAEWEVDFRDSIESALSGPAFPHAQVLKQPLKMLGPVRTLAPYHRSVALTSDRQMHVPEGQSYADSHCFTFDYNDSQVADRHGCWFFRRSFRRLQTLRRCILAELDASSAWRKYVEIAGKMKAGNMDGNETLVDGDGAATEMGKSRPFDSIRRADEIIKSVAFKSWETWDEGIKREIEKKISKTVITKTKKGVLEPARITSIRHSCFLVDSDGADDLSAEAVILKRSLPCYQLMWDQIEVSGGPHQPTSNAITGIDRRTRVEKDYVVPPVCARAAMSLVAEKQKRAPKGYSAKSCTMNCPSWKSCTAPKHFNCICLACCWQKALRRICEINSGCCDPSMATVYMSDTSIRST